MNSTLEFDGTPVRILMVEDSPTQAAQLRFMLEDRGFEVTVAKNGREALAAATASPPTLIISDVIMPEMNGYALCKALKSQPATAPIPVILLTSMSDPVDVIRGLECGADNFVVKPFEEKHLLSRISYLLANRRMREDEGTRMGVEIAFAGQKYFITSDRLQVLNLLLSTYETAIQKNAELVRAQQKLETLTSNLEKRVEERTAALAESEERTRLIIETSHDAVITVDSDGRITGWNSQAEKIFGWSRDEIAGKTLSETIIPERYREAHERGMKQYLASGEGAVLGRLVELSALRRDGAEIPVELSINPVRFAGHIHFSAFVRDISQRKEAEKAIHRWNSELEARVRDRTAQLEAANHELEAFSYSVSHDLRAPLRHITGFVNMLKTTAGSSLSEKPRRYLDIISDSARQMGQLIDDLLVFSRMGRSPIKLEPVDLHELVQETRRDLEPETAGRNIVWRQEALPVVRGDRAMLRQVFVNLISNAVKYSRPRDPAEIEIGANNATPGETVIHIRDNGVGFEMQYVDKLFGVFQRLHSADAFEGTGIGLANVRRIINRHGGRTWAESKVDAGAAFFFSLPNSTPNTP